MDDVHSLLKRQLKKHFGADFRVPPEWERFVESVDAAYREFDSDRAMLERSLDLSSDELLQANSEMRTLFQAIPDMLFRLDSGGTILDCRAGVATDLYLPREKMLGKRIQDIPQDTVRDRFLEAIHQVGLTRRMVTFDYFLRLHDTEQYYEARLLPLIGNQIMAIVRNITTRKRAEVALLESEEKYRSLVENIPVGIYRSTGDFYGRFLQVNPAMVRIFAYDSATNFLETGFADLFQDPAERLLFNHEITINGYVKEREVHLKRRDGTQLSASCTATAQYNIHGEIDWVDGVLEDITERKQAADEMLKASKLESIGILAGGIAHDFNNILTAVIGNISLAKMKADPESEVFRRLIEAEKASLRAQDLTLQLLTFSKGGAPIRKVTSVADILRDSASFMTSGSNVRCEFDIPDDLAPVDIDEGQISQVINNLVINAQQSMPHGGTITIKAENTKTGGRIWEQGPGLPAGDYIKITVQDQGSGIPPEHLDKVFDPYFTTKHRGSGLGLYTAYAIINKHDGHISVKSKEGVGTIFSILLPVSKKKRKVETVRDSHDIQMTGQGRILLMDDEAIVREVAGDILGFLGFDVEFALEGSEACEKYRSAKESGHPFDVVIMDLTIPGGMGGREAITNILAIDPSVKAIASSGYSNDPIMAEHRQYGFCAVVPKPYRLEDLRKTLNRVITGACDQAN